MPGAYRRKALSPIQGDIFADNRIFLEKIETVPNFAAAKFNCKMTYTRLTISIVLCFVLSLGTSHSQPPYNADMMYAVEFLSSQTCGGRSSGTTGSFEAAVYIESIFENARLTPLFKDGYAQPFTTKTAGGTAVCRNLAGIIRGNNHEKYEKPYIIIGAHYDHLGKLDGKIYPGADDNASGVAALGYLARQFAMNRFLKDTASRSVILVAFDAKEYSMAGSRAFVDSLLSQEGIADPVSGEKISRDKIAFMANIDQLGSILEPIDPYHREYLMILGSEALEEYDRTVLEVTGRYFIPDLGIGFDYYGSKKFSDLFLRLSDQVNFVDNGIVSLMFTSGINKHTYKTSDTIANIDRKALEIRAKYIYLFIERLTR